MNQLVSPHWEPFDHPRYKYRLLHAHNHEMKHFEPLGRYRAVIEHDGVRWVSLTGDGLIHIARGYAWDGASGPALDTMSFARASLVHDALYQLIAEGELPLNPWKRHADAELYRIAREDGMSWWRARRVWLAVRLFGRGRDRFRPDGLRSHRSDPH